MTLLLELLAVCALAAPAHQEQSAYVAEQVRAEVESLERDFGEDALEEGGRTTASVVERLVNRLGRLKGDPKVGAPMRPALERLADAVRSYPSRAYAKKHPAEMTRAVLDQLLFDAQRSKSPEELEQRLRKSLDLPVTLKENLPTDVPLERYQQMGPIVIFLFKHRSNAPQGYADITEDDLMGGRYHVEIGVKVRGTVTRTSDAEDGDYCWNLASIESEIPPEWSGASGLCRPEVGDVVEVRGWSYFDTFHQNETHGEKEFNKNRPTVWEIHPVTGCTILQKKAKEKKT